MKKSFGAILALTTAAVTPSYGQTTGEGVLALCQETDTTPCMSFLKGILQGIDYGVTYGALLASEGDQEKFVEVSDLLMPYCIEEGTPLSDLFVAVHNSLLHDQKLKEADASTAVIMSLSKSFPCD